MAWQHYVNKLTSFPTRIIFDLKARLVAAGWIVKASGGGGLGGYDPVGDVWSAYADLGYLSWTRIQSPDGQRELVFQRASYDAKGEEWGSWYSCSGKFTGGSPGESTRPTASDEQELHSSVDLFDGAATNFRYHIIAEDSAPYRFFLASANQGSGDIDTQIFMEFLQSDTYPSEDLDPCIVASDFKNDGTAYGACFWGDYNAVDQFGWLRKGEPDGAFVRMYAPKLVVKLVSYERQVWPEVGYGVGTNPHDGQDDLVPVIWLRPNGVTAPIGWKGISGTFRANLAGRSTGETLNLDGGTKNWAVWGSVIVPWNGGDMDI